jgi:hypothetical protein
VPGKRSDGLFGVVRHEDKLQFRAGPRLAEFDFRYSNRAKLGVDDGERAARAIQGAQGKRLTYRPAH